MNSESVEKEVPDSNARWIPWWLVAVLILGVSLIFGMNYFAVELNDTLAQQDAGVLNFISFGIASACLTLLFVWLFFYSEWNIWMAKVAPIVVGLSIVTFLTLYKPRHGGNIEIIGWEPRFWGNHHQIEDKSELAELGPTTEADFWQFLGPYRNAVIPNVDVSAQQPRIVWKQPIGKGWSGFSAHGKFAFTMEQSGDDELVTCYLIEDGSLVWSYRHRARYQDPTNMGGVGPRCTPTIFDGKLYAHGGTGLLVCLDATNGKLIWKQDVPELVGAQRVDKKTMNGLSYSIEDSRLIWGRSASPLMFGNLVIVPGGGPQNGPFCSLIAFDRNTGAEVWRGGESMISYGSASVAQLDGRYVVTIINENSVAAHDPTTGEELWSHERDGQSNTAANCSQPMQVGEDLILVGKGYGLGGELLQIKDNQVSSLWKESRVVKTKMTVPVVYEGHIYCLSDGILECTELQTGKRKWKRKRFKQGQLLLVGNKLLVHSQFGTLHLIEATPDDYREFESFQLDTIDGICWNMICLQNNDQLLVRSEQEAALIDLVLVSETNSSSDNVNRVSSPAPNPSSGQGNGP